MSTPLSKKLKSAWVKAALLIALTNTATAQNNTATPITMKAHYPNAPETKVILPTNIEGKRVQMTVDADYFKGGRSVASIAQLDPEFSDYMIIPPKEQVAKTHKDLMKDAQLIQKRIKGGMSQYMSDLTQKEQQNILHVLSVLIALDQKKPPNQRKYTSHKVLIAYALDSKEKNGEFMTATNLVINDKDSTKPQDVALIEKHGKTHFSPRNQAAYINFLKRLETESLRVLRESTHNTPQP